MKTTVYNYCSSFKKNHIFKYIYIIYRPINIYDMIYIYFTRRPILDPLDISLGMIGNS